MNINLIFTFLSSFVISIFFFPVIIKVSRIKNLFDSPTLNRKIHQKPIPNIGGVVIFFTVLFCFLVFSNKNENQINAFLASFVLIFLFGLKDDLVALSSYKRFIAQLVAGFLVILIGDFRIQNLSFIGLFNISYSLSVISSLIFFIFIINAYNLIDGINGLLGSLTALSTSAFLMAYIINHESKGLELILCVSMLASILGFLFYNFGDAKIFMGSSGSYIVGLFMYLNTMIILEKNSLSIFSIPKYAFLFSVLAIPVYDTLRVFLLRIIWKKSPFLADANHVHHRLLKLNISHNKIVMILLLTNMFLLGFNFIFRSQSDILIIIFDFIILITLNLILEKFLKGRT
jgi:UDP-GlcNAc:undecaprenyl-phosphate GlcNAc-1-phosphate transferase